MLLSERLQSCIPGLYLSEDNRNTWNKTNTDVPGSTFTQRIPDGRGSERISIQYITPIPGIDADPRFNSAERRNENYPRCGIAGYRGDLCSEKTIATESG